MLGDPLLADRAEMRVPPTASHSSNEREDDCCADQAGEDHPHHISIVSRPAGKGCAKQYTGSSNVRTTLAVKSENPMSRLNGDKARFNKDRVRKLRKRQRVRALAIRLSKPASK